MMKQYLRERERQDKISSAVGAVLAVAIPVCSALFCSFTGLKYIYPPPQESTFVIDFTEEETEPVVQHRNGREPQAEEIDLSKPVELVQRSESQYVSQKQNLTPATAPDEHGDVEVPQTPAEPVLDPRASFPGMSKKDTSLTAPHSATQASEGFKAGQPKGNTDKGAVGGTPNAHLQGRSVVGVIPRPTYETQASGKVVVNIIVNQMGEVINAQAGADGTTVTNKDLWTAARKAALKTRFNVSADAPASQQGSITYIFNLK